MSLINTYGADNRVIEQALVVNYSRKKIYGTWEYVLPGGTTIHTAAWLYTRTARKSYKYVGMTHTAANNCATAMITKFQRTTKISEWDPNQFGDEFGEVNAGLIPMADVAINHTAGQMYEVVISVHEVDERMRLGVHSPAGLFYSENARDYDE